MKNSKLINIIGVLAFAGCSTNNIRFGEYTFDKGSYALYRKTIAEEYNESPTEEGFVDFGERYDTNFDKYITLQETETGLEKIDELARIIADGSGINTSSGVCNVKHPQ